MRTKERFRILLLFLYTFCFISCSDDDNVVGEIVVMSISSKLVWVEVVTSTEHKVQGMIECTIKDSNEKLRILPNQIEGFEYQSGYEYKLRVRITPFNNPSSNGSTERYELIEIISQNKIVPLFNIQLMYAVDAEQKDIIENDLKNNSSFFVGGSYLFNYELTAWTLLDANNVPIESGTLQRKSNFPLETPLPASYQLLQPDEQIATYAIWFFSSISRSEQIVHPYDVIITLMPGGGRDPYYRLWFYEDLTNYYKTKFPNAGVKGVVRVQRLNNSQFTIS